MGKDTPLVDELEKGPWPSFVTEIKKVAERKPAARDLLGQLELSYNRSSSPEAHATDSVCS